MSDSDSGSYQLPPPSLGEIGRSVEETRKALDKLQEQIGETYVRRDVWQGSEQHAGARVAEIAETVAHVESDLKAEIKERADAIQSIRAVREADHRLILTSLVFPVMVAVLAFLIISVFRW